eukprot:TRINITY_DN67_c0_g1_i1.p1 TRINITY_DN67_c0_g1~~TRINITY_DN67_c0_g1_i1.p1  ORF type:complete len:171 (-),score=55.28 TRINITY_DN67_c0_g1_i1:111-578(-)
MRTQLVIFTFTFLLGVVFFDLVWDSLALKEGDEPIRVAAIRYENLDQVLKTNPYFGGPFVGIILLGALALLTDLRNSPVSTILGLAMGGVFYFKTLAQNKFLGTTDVALQREALTEILYEHLIIFAFSFLIVVIQFRSLSGSSSRTSRLDKAKKN